jgi:membrane associated rhomboid family serine protease
MTTYIIIAITILLSYRAFTDKDLMMRMMYIPQIVHERNEFGRAFTHIFIHADWMHLFFNMLVLYNFGLYLEEEFLIMGVSFPQLHFALLYMGAGLFATLLPYSRHKNNPNYMALGASGSVAGVLFAFICVQPEAPLVFVFLPFAKIPAYIVGILYLAYEYYMDKRGGSGIAHDAHIGGALFGICFMLLFHWNKVITAISSIF